MAARLVAAMARPGPEALVFWSRVARAVGGAACGAAYREDPARGGWMLESWEGVGRGAGLRLGYDLFAVAAGRRGSLCCGGLVVARSGAPVELFAAVPGPLSRAAASTAGAPMPARRVGQAVLCLLARRLVEAEGVSLVRLAARLARHGGGEAALLVLVRKPGRAAPAPLVYYASEHGVCVSVDAAAPGMGAAFYGGPCGEEEEARPPGVLHARPQGGVVRVEYVELGEALRA